jgi:hypothetical protein
MLLTELTIDMMQIWILLFEIGLDTEDKRIGNMPRGHRADRKRGGVAVIAGSSMSVRLSSHSEGINVLRLGRS